MPWLALAVLGVLMAVSTRKKPSAPPPDLVELIRREAAAAGVPLQVALAFARVESNFNPKAEGDLFWPKKKPAAYRALVLEGRPDNPYAKDPTLWHSYGLYGLLAAYHVQGPENPRILLDPAVNAHRALAALAKLLRASEGDPIEARYRYVECGEAGAKCADSYRDQVRAKLERALGEFEGAA